MNEIIKMTKEKYNNFKVVCIRQLMGKHAAHSMCFAGNSNNVASYDGASDSVVAQITD